MLGDGNTLRRHWGIVGGHELMLRKCWGHLAILKKI